MYQLTHCLNCTIIINPQYNDTLNAAIEMSPAPIMLTDTRERGSKRGRGRGKGKGKGSVRSSRHLDRIFTEHVDVIVGLRA